MKENGKNKSNIREENSKKGSRPDKSKLGRSKPVRKLRGITGAIRIKDVSGAWKRKSIGPGELAKRHSVRPGKGRKNSTYRVETKAIKTGLWVMVYVVNTTRNQAMYLNKRVNIDAKGFKELCRDLGVKDKPSVFLKRYGGLNHGK